MTGEQVVLLGLIVTVMFSLIGVNLLYVIYDMADTTVDVAKEQVKQTGSNVAATANYAVPATRASIGVAQDASEDITYGIGGGIVKGAAGIAESVTTLTDNLLRGGVSRRDEVDMYDDGVVEGAPWCYIGTDHRSGDRVCANVPDASDCLSKQTYATVEKCRRLVE